MITIGHAISSLCPELQCAIDNNSYEGIRWFDDSAPKPSKEEIMAEVARLQAEEAANAYKEKRAAEYPSIGDQLDALWKGGAEAEAMLAKVQAVKQKYPKGA
jgi:hypothetical protein